MMKLVFICVSLACVNLYLCHGKTTGNQKICVSPGSPVNINVQGKQGGKGEKGDKGDTGVKGDKGTPCRCSLQNPNKPSAHIEAYRSGKALVTYQSGTVIKEWSSSGPYSHLAGGMKYHDGNLTVPITGRYYVYLQIFRYNYGRVQVFVNNNVITQLQTPGGYGTLYVGMVHNLRAGDVIKFTSTYKNFQIFMRPAHSYFGAYLI